MASELHPWELDIRTGIFFQVGYPVAISHFAAIPQSDVVYAEIWACCLQKK